MVRFLSIVRIGICITLSIFMKKNDIFPNIIMKCEILLETCCHPKHGSSSPLIQNSSHKKLIFREFPEIII